MVIKKTIKKEDIKEMPKVLFPGRIHLVQTPWEAEKAVTYLKKYSLLGIDSETRPSFTKGQSHKVALLQVSSEEDEPEEDDCDDDDCHCHGHHHHD